MIKVNLLPVTRKKKKKAKPLPSFIITMTITTVLTGIIMAYLVYYFNSKLAAGKALFAANERKIAELKEKIAAVDNFEQLNRSIQQKKDIIEQLRKNQSIPVKLVDEMSNLLPKGVWLQTMSVTGQAIDVEGFAFTNSEIVSFVDNIKTSKVFSDANLQESKSTNIESIQLYNFKLTCKMKS
jgi:Tfp pilus assembly protein PilN